MPVRKILVLEDEAPIREMIAFQLKRSGFEPLEAANCAEAREHLANCTVGLALVDWMLPDMSGLEFTRFLKRHKDYRQMAVILLTARADEADKVSGLDSGADDYIVKPFAPRELIARIQAVLRRTASQAGAQLQIGNLRLDAESHRVSVDDEDVSLGPTEFRLLKFLMARADRVFSRAQLLDQVWGANVYVEERTVDVHIRRLRKSLELTGTAGLIQTVRGAGYCISERAR